MCLAAGETRYECACERGGEAPSVCAIASAYQKVSEGFGNVTSRCTFLHLRRRGHFPQLFWPFSRRASEGEATALRPIATRQGCHKSTPPPPPPSPLPRPPPPHR